MRRLLKQIFFASIFLGIIGSIGYLLVFQVLFPPSCQDRIKNQGEEGVDCGGPCAPCELKLLAPPVVLRVAYFPNPGKNTIDLAAEIKNPNASWGTKELDWQFILLADSENVLSRIRGKTFLLPGEKRWVISLAAFSPGRVSDVKFEIQREGIDWQRLKPFAKEASIRVLNPAFKMLVPPAVGFAEIRGQVQNNSSFTFGEVEVNALLFDRFERILAVGRTVLQGLESAKTDSFVISWPSRFEGEVSKFEVQAHTNLLSDINFLQRYGQ